MPAPSASDLRRNQPQQGLVGDHAFLQKLAEMHKATKKETVRVGGAEPLQKGFVANPKQPSPTRNHQPAQNTTVKATSVFASKKISGARDASQTQAANHGYAANHPENRAHGKPASDAVRQNPKSPLAALLRKNQVKGGEVNRLLVTVNVLGSAGPLRMLISADDPVHRVMETALKSYAREGRLPVLGQNIKHFDFYCANSGSEALDTSQIIGALGTRNFLLCKKQPAQIQQDEEKVPKTSPHHHHHKSNNIWKNWWSSMSLSFGVSSH